MQAKHLITTALLLYTSATNALAKHYPDPIYLSKTEIALNQVLAPPPAPGSVQDRRDFERIFQHQESRSLAECQRAAFVVDVALNTLFGPHHGPLTETEVRKWENFFETVRVDTDYFVQEAKLMWGRPRPYVADPRVSPCVKRETTNAYPSGHAAISRTFARLLSEIYPKRAKQLMERGDQIGQDRVLAGVHHPTDIQAGVELGDFVFEKLMRNPYFSGELRKLKETEAQEAAFRKH